MRPSSALLIAFLLAVPLAHEVCAGVAVGALGGLTITSWGGDHPPEGEYRHVGGLTLGAELDIGVYRDVSLSLQPAFVQRGTEIAFEADGGREPVETADVNLDYFTLPVLLKVETLGKRFYVTGGFEAAWLLDARYRYQSEDSEVSSEFREYDLLADIGIGYTIPAVNSEVFLEVRYSQSMINTGTEDTAAEDHVEPRVKNEGIMLLLGVLHKF